MLMLRVPALSLLAVLAACTSRPPAEEPPGADATPAADSAGAAHSLDGREWILESLGEAQAPAGAGGRTATIQFDPANLRASGFAGCNRYSATYTLAGDDLTFGPAMATKMACQDGDELERRYLAILPEVRSYALSDSTLTLSGAAGVLARFRAP
jgi:heat shock protein HslJ